jgi:hypothetical protein
MIMYLDRRRVDRIVKGALTLAFALALAGGTAKAADTLHFAVGPLQPTPGETKKAFDPFFKRLAEQLGVTYTLEATTDWAGIAVALTSGQVDVAWMGPWGYVIAHNQGAGDAVATAKYDGKPVYHAIVIARPDLQITNGPMTAKDCAYPLPMWVRPPAGSFQPSGSNRAGSTQRHISNITRAPPMRPTRYRWPMGKPISRPTSIETARR